MTPIMISSLAIIGLAALIHASLQLSISMLTLLSGHAIGKKTRHTKLLRLATHFVAGAGIMTALLLISGTYFLQPIITDPKLQCYAAIAISCALVIIGLATWIGYYRRKSGTILWLPRNLAQFLARRSRATRSSAESLSLGLSSVIAELLFIIGPVAAASFAILHLPSRTWQIGGLGLYLLLSLLPLIVIVVLIGGGTTIARIQRWREASKHFLQFAAGGCLIILAAFLLIDRALGPLAHGGIL